MTAEHFINELHTIGKNYSGTIPRREIFALSKKNKATPVEEVINLLRDDSLDHRLGAVSIMDWKARDSKTSDEEREAIYRAYIDNHKWIDNWGLVDRSAPYVVGGYLYDKDRQPLYDLARSTQPMKRRTAIVSTYYFIRKNDLQDTFKIARILVADDDVYVQKAVGSWIREAGKQDEDLLRSFLDDHARHMPSPMLRYAVEKIDPQTRKIYLDLNKEGRGK